MRSYYIAVEHRHKAKISERTYRPPESRFTSAWIGVEHGRLRVDVAIIGPKSEEIQNDVEASRRKIEELREAISNLIVTFQEALRG